MKTRSGLTSLRTRRKQGPKFMSRGKLDFVRQPHLRYLQFATGDILTYTGYLLAVMVDELEFEDREEHSSPQGLPETEKKPQSSLCEWVGKTWGS